MAQPWCSGRLQRHKVLLTSMAQPCVHCVCWRLQFWEERILPAPWTGFWMCCRAVAMPAFVGSERDCSVERSPMSECADSGRVLLCLRFTGECFALSKVISWHLIPS